MADDVPDLPFEKTVGVLSFIQPRWWEDNQEALDEAVAYAAFLDAHRERRIRVGEPIPVTPVHRLTLTVEEGASALGISRSFAYEAISKGEIPCIRIGKRILVPKVALERLLDSAGAAGLQSRQWQATNGSTRRTVEIVADRLRALTSKSAQYAPAAWPPGLAPGGAHPHPIRNGTPHPQRLLGFGRTGLHGAALRQGGPSRRFAPGLPRKWFPFLDRRFPSAPRSRPWTEKGKELQA